MAARQSNQAPPSYTPLALKALSLARTEAERLGNNYLGAEHVMLGVLAVGQGGALNTMQKLGLDLDEIRKQVEQQARPGHNSKQEFVYTPRVRRILKCAAEEAEAINKEGKHIGTEHILLGFLREGDSLPARVLLHDLELDVDLVRQELVHDQGAVK